MPVSQAASYRTRRMRRLAEAHSSIQYSHLLPLNTAQPQYVDLDHRRLPSRKLLET